MVVKNVINLMFNQSGFALAVFWYFLNELRSGRLLLYYTVKEGKDSDGFKISSIHRSAKARKSLILIDL